MEKDIIIIGGGPSGLSTALHLQQLSPELAKGVLILEKTHYPRPKLCAGGLVADAEYLLEKLGLDVSEVPHVDSRAVHFDFEGKGLTVHMPGTQRLRVIRRDEFDAWLAGKAYLRGIEIRQDVAVKTLKTDESGVILETNQGTFRAKMVVGADGSNGVVRRAILPGEPVHTARVLEVLAAPNPNSQHAKKESYFEFAPVIDGIAGYTWDFPTQLNGQPMQCWGIYDTNMAAEVQRPPFKESLAAEMAKFGYDLAESELNGHPIRWYHPRSQVSAPRVLLVGDAAGADPLFGEGISMALGYGKLAARQIRDAFAQNDFEFLGYRGRLMRSPLGQTLVVRWFIARVIYKLRWRWFHIFLWRMFKPVVLLAAWIFVLNWARRMK